jgi:hypothetical protein
MVISPLKGNSDSESVTIIVKLNQNYPTNPFNPSTQYPFILHKDWPVKIGYFQC